MVDQRPPELTSYQESTKEINDRLILKALEELGDPAKRGRRKPIVATVCKMTGLARNTIRNREWALKKLQEIKRTLKNGHAADSNAAVQPTVPTLVQLRERIGRILQQNALLYEQILELQETISRKDREIGALKDRKNLSIVPPRGGANR
ncbi:hypothetical protein [Paraburkholderia tropica]|uniref:hypothetical protein n=1 Tax=Paraburkholderia tropica TaxID=92647 RepID=UPI002AB7CEDC|nr:hypothetical protein [Paraburkholderia tropica]